MRYRAILSLGVALFAVRYSYNSFELEKVIILICCDNGLAMTSTSIIAHYKVLSVVIDSTVCSPDAAKYLISRFYFILFGVTSCQTIDRS